MGNIFYNLHECLGFMTITTNRKMGALLHRKMKQADVHLTSEQWGILAQIWNQKNLTQEELAYASCVDKSTMSRALRHMERNGLIARHVDPADARRKILRSTPKADMLKDRSAAVAREVLALALENVGPADRATALRVLMKVKENLRRHSG